MRLVHPEDRECRVISVIIEDRLAEAWIARVERRYGYKMEVQPADTFHPDIGGMIIGGAPKTKVEVDGCTFCVRLNDIPWLLPSLRKPTSRDDWSEELGCTVIALHMRHLHLIMSLTLAQELYEKLDAEFRVREPELDAFYNTV